METKDSLQSTVVRALMMVTMVVVMIMMMIVIVITVNEVPLNAQSADQPISLSSVGFDTR